MLDESTMAPRGFKVSLKPRRFICNKADGNGMKILFLADCQLGKNYKFKRNVEIGVSERTVDLLKPVIEIARYAVENGVKIVVFAGDLYDRVDRPAINQTIKKMFRKYVILPLRKQGIEILVIGGNHDSPDKLNAGCDIEEFVIADTITVRRNLGTKIYDMDGERIGFVAMPFLTPETVYDVYMNKNGNLPARSEYVDPSN
jgi:DNA repair exonuclease SbcCD nuclease subunit